MKNKVIIVTGLPRSGTSMMMRTLEMGGIQCAYNENREEKEKIRMRNIYGFYEGGTIPEVGTVAVKRFGAQIAERLAEKYDCWFIFMDRHPDKIKASWEEANSKAPKPKVKVPRQSNTSQTLADSQKKIKNVVNKHRHIVINYDKINTDSENELLRLKKFLPVEFDVGKALKAIDKTLYINR